MGPFRCGCHRAQQFRINPLEGLTCPAPAPTGAPMSDRKIGFVGVGRMGANMARRLKDQGYVISAIYDRQSDAAKALATELGA